MNSQQKKKYVPLLEAFIICAIILVLTVFYFIFKNEYNKFTNKTSSTQALVMETKEYEDKKHQVTVVEEKTTNLSLQYPRTKDVIFNEKIKNYIDQQKANFTKNISSVNKNGSQTTELSFINFKKNYSTAILTTTTYLPEHHPKTEKQLFFYETTTGKLLPLSYLFNHDTKSILTFESYIEKTIKKPAITKLVGQIDWTGFHHYSIKNHALTIVLDPENREMDFNLSMDYFNALLMKDFQQEMTMENPTTISKDDTTLKVALTFDDGPHPQVTPKILDMLDQYNAKATFFMVGQNVENYPEIAKEVLKRGHEIGNHTWSHPNLKTLSLEQVKKEFETTEKAIIAATGQPSTLFRPPFGISTDAINKSIPRESVNWNVDTEDWRYRNAAQLLPMIQRDLKNNSTILMHDIHDSTANGLESVLKYLSEQNYTFVKASALID